MSTKHWRGPVIPEAGDDLLAAWDTMLDTSGVVMVASSIASARAMMSTAETAGTTINSTYPAYFDIGGILYKADGSKGSDGDWRLRPVNETSTAENSYGGGRVITKGPYSRTVLITSSLSAVPYDRKVFATGMLSGIVSVGGYSVGVSIRGTDWQDARLTNTFKTNGSDMSSATAINLGTVPAGEDPQVQMSVISGGGDTNRVDISDAASACKLVVMAFPITMA